MNYLFLKQQRDPPCIDVVQYNNLLPICFCVVDYEIPQEAIARIFVKKPSGHTVYNDCEISGDIVKITPTTQMFAEIGVNDAQIQIIVGDKCHATFPFAFIVSGNLSAENAEESTDESLLSIPIATADTVGGITADPKTKAQTMPVGIDPQTGRLYTESGGAGYPLGDGLKVVDGKLTVDTADAVEQDNTRPVTSAAVYTEVGNIEVLLANI